MTSESESRTDATNSDELVSRLRVIEDQPLESRAEAFAHVYRELQESLEGSDSAR
jgi:hypothetical protein